MTGTNVDRVPVNIEDAYRAAALISHTNLAQQLLLFIVETERGRCRGF